MLGNHVFDAPKNLLPNFVGSFGAQSEAGERILLRRCVAISVFF
jgi:hypothetical protein